MRRKKVILLGICFLNIFILAATAAWPKLAANKNNEAIAVIGLEYPLSINTISIELYNGTLEYIQESQDNILQGAIEVYGKDGFLWYKGELERFKGRGNNSWFCPKKGYGMTLVQAENLLNLGKARGFVLTPTYRDASLLNFKIAYDLSREVGCQYAHNADYVELYVNYEYLGVYILTEQNEINKDRYNITNLEELSQAVNEDWLWNYPFESEWGLDNGREVETKGYYLFQNPANITGGYLLELDQADKVTKSPSRFRSASGTPIGLRDPAYASKEQIDYISEFYQDFEDALYAKDGYNSKGKYYLDYIDLDSFVKTWIMNELTMDTSILSSQFLWKDSDGIGDGKFHAGNVWDMEHSFVEKNRTIDYLRGDGFWGSFYQHPEFRERVYYIWMEKYIPAIRKLYGEPSEYLSWKLNSIDTYADYISVAAKHNFEKWDESFAENVDDRELASWEEEIDYVKRFIAERSAYLTVAFSAWEKDYQRMYAQDGGYWGIKQVQNDGSVEEVTEEYIPDVRIARVAEEMSRFYRGPEEIDKR